MKLALLPGPRKTIVDLEDICAILRVNPMNEAVGVFMIVLKSNPTPQAPILDDEMRDALLAELEKQGLLITINSLPKVVV